MPRFRITSLAVLVAAFAAGLGTMRIGSEVVFKVLFLLLVFAILVGLLGAILHKRDGAWTGFAVFICGYAAVAWYFELANDEELLLTNNGVILIADSLHPIEIPLPRQPEVNAKYVDQIANGQPTSRRPMIVGRTTTSSVEEDLLYERLCRYDYSELDTSMLNASEHRILKDYQTSVRDHRTRVTIAREKHEMARLIGMLWTIAIAGLLGSMSGQFLAWRMKRTAALALLSTSAT